MKTIEIPPHTLKVAGLILAGHRLSQIRIEMVGDASGKHIFLSGPAAAIDKFLEVYESVLELIGSLPL